MSEPTKLNLPRGSYELLNSALNQNGWTAKRRELNAAGYVIEKIEPLIDDRPIFTGSIQNGVPTDAVEWDKHNKVVKAWQREILPLNLTDVEYQSCISCLKHATDERRIPSSFYASSLLEAFKLTE